MMMGPTKKKVITTGIIAFTIPVVISGVAFWQYNKKKEEEIAELKRKTATTKAYVFADNLIEGDTIVSSDLLLVDVKGESAPIDSFSGDRSELVGRRVRINAEKKTIVTESMLMDEVDTNPGLSERLQEFNMFLLPSDLVEGDYVDLRITFPSGENYIIVSGKEIKKLGNTVDSNTFFVQLDEEEIIRTTAAILESYMSDGIKIYATKYVEPSAQLYKSERINYVEKFEDALEFLYNERLALVSGDNADIDEYIFFYVNDKEKAEEIRTKYNSGEQIYISKDEITNSQISQLIGLTEKQTADIRDALSKNDVEILDLYNDKLVRTRLDMKETYPVKQNIAVAIAENPNILEELKQKYNIDELIEKRSRIQEFAAYKINEYTNEVEATEALSKLQTNLNKEIETQKSERKEYLQALLLDEE